MNNREACFALGASAVALVAFGWFAFYGSTESQKLVGFGMAAVGGIAAALGELAGSNFGGGSGFGKRGAVTKTAGFIGLTLGSLLTALPDANAAVEGNEGLATQYILSLVGVVALVVVGLPVALYVSRTDESARKAHRAKGRRRQAAAEEPEGEDKPSV